MLNGLTPEAIQKERAKRHLFDFLLYDGQGRWQAAKHLRLLCEKLEAVARGEITRLIVSMPPRHGKSEVISKKFPAWFLGKFPEKEIIITSYSADLAYDFSKIARNTLKEHSGLFGVNIDPSSSAAGRWGIEGKRGGMTAAGVGGPITGRGAHIFIIDDPVKNAEEAASETVRANVKEWYKTTARTRLAGDNAAVVVVMTRWHEDDLAGWLISQEMNDDGEKFEIINFPAIAEDVDALGRSEGEYLWPERFSDKFYLETKKAVGSRAWAALYQQRPSPQEGEIFKRGWWQYYKVKPDKFDRIIQSWDCTFKDAKGSDYVVGQIWGCIGANRYLLDWIKAKLDFPATVQAIRNLSAKWPQAREKIIEDKANGPAIISMLRDEIPGLIAVNPEGGKVVRAQAVSPYVESGNVFIPDPALDARVNDFVEECAAFPNGKHDDQVDSMTQALCRLQGNVKKVTTRFNY